MKTFHTEVYKGRHRIIIEDGWDRIGLETDCTAEQAKEYERRMEEGLRAAQAARDALVETT